MSDLIIRVRFGDNRPDWTVANPATTVTYEDPSGSGSTIRRDADGVIYADLKVPGSHIEFAMNSATGWQP